MNVIEIDNLTKHYRSTRALDRATWSLPRGRLLGFLGPNGAGKTTTIRILLGFLRATCGRATIFGLDTWSRSAEIRGRLGYLAGDVQLYRQLTGRQILEYVANARGMRDPLEANRLAQVLQIDLDVRARECSKGMRQKIGLIAAMMHRPELLILDEPTASLDPLMQQALYRELRAAVARGATVLFSSHSLSEVEALCQDVVILRAGRVVASQRIDALRRQAGKRVHLRFASGSSSRPKSPDAFTEERYQNGSLVGLWRGSTEELMRWLAGLAVEDVVIERPDLEDVFLGYYGGAAGNSK